MKEDQRYEHALSAALVILGEFDSQPDMAKHNRLALVVFSSWRPGRLVLGAYLFGAVSILQLHTQAFGLGIPSQLMSALPYLATVIVLVLISRTRGTAGSAAPASLGQVFVPDR